MDKKRLSNEDYINEKIDQYNKKISNKFYQTVSIQFKEKVLKKYGHYRSITSEFLDSLLEGSDFQDLCFSDIGFTMRKNDLFWVDSLEKSFIELIDFEALRDYEVSTLKATEINNINKASFYSVGKQYTTRIKYLSQSDINLNSTIDDFVSKNYFLKIHNRHEEKRKDINHDNIINSNLKEKKYNNDKSGLNAIKGSWALDSKISILN